MRKRLVPMDLGCRTHGPSTALSVVCAAATAPSFASSKDCQ